MSIAQACEPLRASLGIPSPLQFELQTCLGHNQSVKLPNVHLATVPEPKVTRYLLNPAHPAGGSKAVLFLRFGFTTGHWQQLADALLRHAKDNEVVDMEQTQHGTRYMRWMGR